MSSYFRNARPRLSRPPASPRVAVHPTPSGVCAPPPAGVSKISSLKPEDVPFVPPFVLTVMQTWITNVVPTADLNAPWYVAQQASNLLFCGPVLIATAFAFLAGALYILVWNVCVCETKRVCAFTSVCTVLFSEQMVGRVEEYGSMGRWLGGGSERMGKTS